MTTLRAAWARLVAFFRKDALDQELNEELAAHVELATTDYARQGLNPREARRLALVNFGGIERAKELHRASRGLPWLDGVFQDLRAAARSLRRSPGVTVAAVTMLALGIGVNAAVFTVTDAVLFKGFPLIDRNDRILYIDSRTSGRGCCLSYPDFEDWQANATSFEDMAVANGLDLTLGDQSLPETLFATQVSVNAFQVLGQRPIIGRDLTSADATPGAAPVAILSYGLWERRYGKDPAIVGQTVRMGGIAAGSASVHGESSSLTLTTIIGVMPAGFSFPFNETLWVPLVPTPSLQQRAARSLWFAFGRLVDGATIDAARAELHAIGGRLAIAYPLTNEGIYPSARTFNEFFGGPDAALVYGSMWGAVGFVLLIACANLANLLLARAVGRTREMSLRMALGAGRWRIVRQLLIESVMLSALGGVLGWSIAAWSVRLYVLTQQPGTNYDYAMDYRVLGYLIAISIGTGLLFGFAPARRLSRLDLNATLKDGGSRATGERGRRLSALLVGAQLALAVVLLAGAGVMVRSVLKIYTADVGVNTANVLTMSVALPLTKYPPGEMQSSFFDRLTSRLEAVPGVESIAFSHVLPTGYARSLPYELAGAPPVDERHRPTLSVLIISPGYFRTLEAAVLSGREFEESDDATGLPVVLVNERFATTFWPGEDPLGQRLRLFDGATPHEWLTVVGVVSNIVQNDRTGHRIDPLIYVPYRQNRTGRMVTIARTRVPPGSLGPVFRREIQELDADLPILFLSTLADRLEWNYRDQRLVGVLFSMFATMALLLATGGLNAVIAHSVSQRTQEIGIRTTVGATAGDIHRLVFRQGLVPVGLGLALGLPAAVAMTPVLESQLVNASPSDPITFALVTSVLVVSAILGCWLPARRATRVDPVVTLRHE